MAFKVFVILTTDNEAGSAAMSVERPVSLPLAAFTAQSIALNYAKHLPDAPDAVILAGGGGENSILRTRLAEALLLVGVETTVLQSSDLGWPSESIEPAAFALLAWLRWHRRAGNLPGTTGARRAVLCGQVTEG